MLSIPYEINLMLKFCIKNIDQNINYTFRPTFIKKKRISYVNKTCKENITVSEND